MTNLNLLWKFLKISSRKKTCKVKSEGVNLCDISSRILSSFFCNIIAVGVVNVIVQVDITSSVDREAIIQS